MKVWTTAILLLCLTMAAGADSLLDTNNDLFAPRAITEGDLVTITISDRSQTIQQVDVANASKGGIAGPLAALTKTITGIDLGHDDNSQRQESANSTTRYSDTVTARVIKVEADRLYLQAAREVSLDGKKKSLTLEGVCRRSDLGPDNTIPSDLVADAKIKVDGVYHSPVQPGILTRMFRILF